MGLSIEGVDQPALPSPRSLLAVCSWTLLLKMASETAVNLETNSSNMTSRNGPHPTYDVRKVVQAWKYPTEDLVNICAHRGATHLGGTENSFESIREAVKDGWEAIEIDLRLTKDGEVVVFHDEGLGRLTNVTVPPGEEVYNPFTGMGYSPKVKDVNWAGDMEHLLLRDHYGNVSYDTSPL